MASATARMLMSAGCRIGRRWRICTADMRADRWKASTAGRLKRLFHRRRRRRTPGHFTSTRKRRWRQIYRYVTAWPARPMKWWRCAGRLLQRDDPVIKNADAKVGERVKMNIHLARRPLTAWRSAIPTSPSPWRTAERDGLTTGFYRYQQRRDAV